MDAILGTVLLVAAVGIGTALVLQVHSFVNGRSVISARQLGLRFVCGVLLLGIIAMIYYGQTREWNDPLRELLFWSILLVLPLLVIVLAYMDLKETQLIGELRQAELETKALMEQYAAEQQRSKDGKDDE
jgi:hypothetical protein